MHSFHVTPNTYIISIKWRVFTHYSHFVNSKTSLRLVALSDNDTIMGIKLASYHTKLEHF